MENKINIAEILKKCPKGMELDCMLFNKVTFETVTNCGIWINYIDHNNFKSILHLTSYGEFDNGDIKTKCIIFPKGKTSWEGFHRPFKDGDIIADNCFDAICIFKSEGRIKGTIDFYCGINAKNEFCIKNIKDQDEHFGDIDEYNFATKEEKAKLFQAIKENGYRWNTESKTLEKLTKPKFKIGDVVIWKHSTITPKIIKKVQQANDGNFNYWIEGDGCIPGWCREDELQKSDKFDINILVPFEDKVLVRNTADQRWLPAFWGYKVADGFITTYGWSKYCIPYKGNEHLFKTSNDCSKFFKVWED